MPDLRSTRYDAAVYMRLQGKCRDRRGAAVDRLRTFNVIFYAFSR